MTPDCNVGQAASRSRTGAGLRGGPRNPLPFTLYALAGLILAVLTALTLVAAEGYFSGWLLSSIEAQNK